jgi:hypothetical protein
MISSVLSTDRKKTDIGNISSVLREFIKKNYLKAIVENADECNKL